MKDLVRELRSDNVRLRTEQEMSHVDEMDKQINDLILKVRDYKHQSETYRQNYLEALKQAREIQIDYDSRMKSGGGYEQELVNLKK